MQMIALDTNMLVRALISDNPAEVDIVRRLMAANTFFISDTVLLETERVLRARYQKTPAQFQQFLDALLETDNTVIEAADTVIHARDWYAQGADFADALHLAACDTAVMHTFDRDFCKAARNAGNAPAARMWEA